MLLDRKIYFTAGIWPFMGIFVHAVDAASGESIWINSGEAMRYVVQPHQSPAFGSFVPRGHLAATPYGLVAPGGRTDPAVYDLETGKMLHFNFGAKGAGACEVAALGPWFFLNGTMRRMADGQLQSDASADVYEGNTLYALTGDPFGGGSRLVAREVRTEDLDRERGDGPSWYDRRRTAGVATAASRFCAASPGGQAGQSSQRGPGRPRLASRKGRRCPFANRPGVCRPSGSAACRNCPGNSSSRPARGFMPGATAG